MSPIQTIGEPTATQRKANAKRQAELRARRRAMMTRLTVWVPRTTARDVATICDRLDCTRTQLITFLVRQYLDETEGQLPLS